MQKSGYPINELIQIDSSPAANVSFLLNSILKNYDKTFRPGFDKNRPTDVFIDIYVRTMGPISEFTDTYAFDCYFRQTWTDERLRFEFGDGHEGRTLSLAMSMLDKIWKPDTYFWNGAGSYIHMLTSPNRLVRLREDGTVLYSSRLTVKAKCKMLLARYPLDRQACRLVVGSFAYTAQELTFRWKPSSDHQGVKIDVAAVAQLPQFEVSGYEVFNTTNHTRDVPYSTLEVRFYLSRHVGYFLMNFYVPCTLIVLLCWVAFWINREATNDRLGLGITSVLTMTFISIDSRADAPKVDFPTALDVYIWICYSFLFGCIVVFTVVHYHTKYRTGDPEIQEIEREKMRQLIRSIPKKAVLSSRYYNRPHHRENKMQQMPLSMHNGYIKRTLSDMTRRDGGRHSLYNKTRATNRAKRVLSPQSSTSTTEPVNLADFQQENVGWRLYYWLIDHFQNKNDPFGIQENSMSSVDKFARIVIPLAFGFVVCIYYIIYMNSSFDFQFDSII
ncbi:unnamed protein product, partial [Mesorhabditis belari]|uniref:Uncharacterized protein n=1 Tax=Mesorhabditis belari TaxID=2138241 RepID=A0AAF3EBC0_9BILA